MTTAVMIGATGLVGSELLTQLLADPRFDKVTVLTRRATGKTSPKLDEKTIDFDRPDSWSSFVTGDVAFSCLGTTIKAAGSQEAMRKVDLVYPLEFAKAAAKNGIRNYGLCSAASANADSGVFYSRIKGELDRDVQQLGFERVRIMRPSLLGGNRENPRFGEKMGSLMLTVVNAIGIARKYREIHGNVVAKALINASFDPTPGTKIFTLDQVFAEAERA